MSGREEPGRSRGFDGRAVYAWPPEGQYRELWRRCALTFSDDEKHELLGLLMTWRRENSTCLGYDYLPSEWVDVEPTWSDVYGWLEP